MHVNDDDLSNPSVKERPLSEPTTMSYFLQRLKVAEVARCIADAIPQDPPDATCELILSLDSKLESLIQNLPTFYRIEIASSAGTALIDQTHPYIPIQRLLINLMINLMRCKLHFPYLSGDPSSPIHALSRKASLKAARHVLAAHRDMSTPDIRHSADFMKLQGTVFHIFMGALILATDLCCNQPSDEDRERQLSELTVTLRQLHDIKQHSQIAAQFLEKLTQLLVKYGVWSTSTAASLGMDQESGLDAAWVEPSQMGMQDLDAPFPFEYLWDAFVEQRSVSDKIGAW
jgi:hypothetical protein